MSDENKYKHYKIRGFLENAKIIETNSKIIADPQMLVQKSESDGFLAIIQLAYPGDKKEDTINYLNKHGCPLLTKQEYYDTQSGS